MNNFTAFIIFAAGAVAGSLGTLIYLRKYVNNHIEDQRCQLENEYEKKLNDQKMAFDRRKDAEKAMEDYNPDTSKPYRINEEQFEENPVFDSDSLTLYKNNVLVYDYNNDVVDDVDELIGLSNIPDSDYANDMFWICNEQREMYYEITISNEEYKLDDDDG